jgi:hypothetical protein
MRTVLARILLALAVVLFQHGAVAHAFVHAGEAAQHEHDGNTHAPHGCDACHAYLAADGGEPPPAAFVLPVRVDVAPAPAADAAPAAPRPLRNAPIRAPPAHS